MLCLPHPHSLITIGGGLKIREGGDPMIYSLFQEEVQERKGNNIDEIIGHVMLDEVKLKNGIAYNCKSNAVTGFLPEHMDTKNVYQNILNKSSCSTNEDSSKKATVYANQWRFRSTLNLVHNADFFFNNGSLDGNELIRQMILVISSYEFIGVKIFGIVSDAGGGNSKMFRLLQGHNAIEGPWPDANCLSFTNPVDISRSVYIWSCGTHSFKAMRNNIYRSQPNKTRSFTSHGIPFGWHQIVHTFDRDMARLKDVAVQRTDLTKLSVYLDNFSIMNASYAKKCFSERTISEIIAHVALEMNIKLNIGLSFESLWHKFVYYLGILKSAKDDKTPIDTQSYIALLGYQISVYGIYIERFLNKKWYLNRSNIVAEKLILKEAITYFTEWKNERETVMTRYNMSIKETDKFFIADVSFENMLQCIGGFVAYSEAILSLPDSNGILYVPGLHCNQSSLENFFSRMRQLGKDRTDLYAGGVLQQNVMNDIKSSNKKRKIGNTSYPEWMINKEQLPIRKEIRIGEVVTFKRKQIKDLIDTALTSLTPNCIKGTVVSSNFISVGSAFGTLFLDDILALSLPDDLNYQSYCMTDTFFQGYHSLSLNSRSETWFNNFAKESYTSEVDTMCKLFSTKLFHLFEQSLMQHNKTRVSFQLNILEFLQNNGIETLVNNLAPTLKDNSNCLLILFIFLSKKFVDEWVPHLIQIHKQKICLTHSTFSKVPFNSVDGEVNRIVGWALFATLKKYHKMANKYEDKNTEKTMEVIAMLEDIKAIESDILQDEEYIRKYYCVDDAIRNRSSLTLISRPYIKDLSILSRYLAKEYSSVAKLKATSTNVKVNVKTELTKGSHVSYIDSLVSTSIKRIQTIELKKEDRFDIFQEILNRVSNAKIGSTINNYRTENFSGVNKVQFRSQLAVLSAKKEISSEKRKEIQREIL